MIRTTLLTVTFILSIIAQAPSQFWSGKQKGEPIPATAKICGNVQVLEHDKMNLFLQIQSEGCDNVTFVYIANGYWLGYGTKILISDIEP